jgi:hypothetical protein
MAEQKYSHTKTGNGPSGRDDTSQRGVKFVHVAGYVAFEYDIEQETACPCDWLPFPHIHSRFWKKMSMQRFRVGGPPLSREEYSRFVEDAA